MQLKFYKYQGTGNDFIIFDNRNLYINVNNKEWFKQICNRRFGIGADGVMLLQEKEGFDFEMIYFNSDGSESSMCGNGGRCMVKFADLLGIKKDKYEFIAIDGVHEVIIEDDIVHLKMNDVDSVSCSENYYELNTGSPHYVVFIKALDEIDVKTKGAEIRYNDKYSSAGINVNFLEEKNNNLNIRTYERGVEDETFSCGTGVTASAIIYSIKKDLPEGEHLIELITMGGKLKVQLTKRHKNVFSDIWLIGHAEMVFEGKIEEEDIL